MAAPPAERAGASPLAEKAPRRRGRSPAVAGELQLAGAAREQASGGREQAAGGKASDFCLASFARSIAFPSKLLSQSEQIYQNQSEPEQINLKLNRNLDN